MYRTLDMGCLQRLGVTDLLILRNLQPISPHYCGVRCISRSVLLWPLNESILSLTCTFFSVSVVDLSLGAPSRRVLTRHHRVLLNASAWCGGRCGGKCDGSRGGLFFCLLSFASVLGLFQAIAMDQSSATRDEPTAYSVS